MHGNARFESAESLSLQVEESVDISIQPVRVCRQVQTCGRGHKCPNTRCRILSLFHLLSVPSCLFFMFLSTRLEVLKVPLKKKKKEKIRRGCQPCKSELELFENKFK